MRKRCGPHVLNPDNLTLRVTAYAGAGAMATPAAGQAGAGAAGETVLYELTYQQPFLSPFPALLLGRGSLDHTSRMIVRNEPFPAS